MKPPANSSTGRPGVSTSLERTRESILAGAQTGNDSVAWTRFWLFYQPILKRYIRRLRVKDQDVDDVLQDLSVKLLDALPRFELDHQRGQFRGWLRSLTDNAIRDRFRKFQRQTKRDQALHEYTRSVQNTMSESSHDDTERDRLWVQNLSEIVMKQVRKEFAHRPTTLACFEETILKGRKAKDVAAELGIASANAVHASASRVFARVKALKLAYDDYAPDELEPPAVTDE